MGGDSYINSLLTISTPHLGCRLAQQLRDNVTLANHQLIVEPAIRGLGIHYSMFLQEYTEQNMREMNKTLINSPTVNYASVGARKIQVKASESLRITNEIIFDSTREDYPNDGIVATKEAVWGNHLMNFDADHFELIGLRPDHNPKELFQFYSNTVKYYDEGFKDKIKV